MIAQNLMCAEGKSGPDPFNLTPVWDAVLSIYLEFAKVCDKYHLRFYLAYGNVLGAVRHGGFIPWDDDFDVMMPRADYQKFLSIASKELPEYFKLVSWKNTPEFSANLFAKIMDCRHEYLDELEMKVGKNLNQGVFIDIFPLDGIPRSRMSLACLKLKKLFLDVISFPFSKSFGECTKVKQVCVWVLGRLLGVVSGIRNRMDVNRHLEKIISVESFDEAERCGCILSPYGFLKDVCDVEIFGSPILLQFSGVAIPSPAKPDKYLEAIYGDYMSLPPVEKRKPSHLSQKIAPWRFGPTKNEAK